MTEDEKLSLAKRQVAAIKGFYIHLAVFVLGMTVPLISARGQVGGCSGHCSGGALVCSDTHLAYLGIRQVLWLDGSRRKSLRLSAASTRRNQMRSNR